MCKTVYWDLRNNNMNRDVQEGCANGLYRVCTCNPSGSCVLFYIYNDHTRTVLLSTFTLLFTVTGDLEKTWRAQNRQILLVRSQNILINSSNELRSYVNKLFLVTYEYDSVSFFFYKQRTQNCMKRKCNTSYLEKTRRAQNRQ